MRRSFVTLAAAWLAIGCASEVPEPRLNERTEYPGATPIAPFAECRVTTYDEPASSANHVDACSDLPLPSHPPTGGDHFGVWATWGTYDAPVPWGFLIHAMEHGGVVLAYRCDEGCPDVVAELESIAASIDDPLCRSEDTSSRVIVLPMPDLDVAIAAVSWEHAYLATCLDTSSLQGWVDAHYGQGREDLCFAGTDLSATGWCP